MQNCALPWGISYDVLSIIEIIFSDERGITLIDPRLPRDYVKC